MSLNSTPSADRLHIAFFGKRNAGKSSLVNAVTAQSLAIVSDTAGTTTDPVSKAMELLPLGPVVIIDTPGIDDEGELGALRVKRSYQVLNKTDVAVLVIDSPSGKSHEDDALIERFKAKEIPYIIAYNKSDISAEKAAAEEAEIKDRKSEAELCDARCQKPPDNKRDQVPADIVGLDQRERAILIQSVKKEKPVKYHIGRKKFSEVILFSCEKSGDKSKRRHMKRIDDGEY